MRLTHWWPDKIRWICLLIQLQLLMLNYIGHKLKPYLAYRGHLSYMQSVECVCFVEQDAVLILQDLAYPEADFRPCLILFIVLMNIGRNP